MSSIQEIAYIDAQIRRLQDEREDLMEAQEDRRDMGNRIRTCAVLALTLLVFALLGVYGAVCEEQRQNTPGSETEAEVIRLTAGRMTGAPQTDTQRQAGRTTGPEAYTKPAWTSLRCRIYHYCECDRCCGKHEGDPAYGITATGTRVTEGRTVAVDPEVIPLGSEVLINGHSYRAEDTGVHGDAIDIYVPDHEQAVQMGTYETVVLWR